MKVDGQLHAPATLHPSERTQYPLDRRPCNTGIWKKGKVVLGHTMKTYSGTSIAVVIVNLGTKFR